MSIKDLEMNQTHCVAIQNFLSRIRKSKIEPIETDFFSSIRTSEQLPLDKKIHNAKSLLQQLLERFVAIPKIKTLWEFSFLFQNLYEIGEDYWESIHFRGEARKYRKPCNCGAFREDPVRTPKEEIEEVRRFQQSEIGKHIQQDYLNSFSDELRFSHYWWWFLTQHYAKEGGYRTRLLDVTRNPYVALYWACQETKDEDDKVTYEDGHVYIMLDLMQRELEHRPDESPKCKQWKENPYQTFEEYINDSQEQFDISRLVRMKDRDLGRGYVLLKRLIAQSGEFIYQREYIPQNFVLVIDAFSKDEITRQLKNFMNIDKEHLLIEK